MTTIDLAEATRMLESAEKGVEHARNALYTAVAERQRAEHLSEKLNFLAECEGAYLAVAQMQRALQWGYDHNETVDWQSELVDQALNGADDTWSGRGNDAKRAQHDGFRKQVQRLVR